MNPPFFSIIIPTHNRSHLILDTLRSLQVQTFHRFECIIVDDGGTDDTAEQVEQLGDSRFRYIWNEHGERGAARNRGVQESQGEYVYFLDSDDFLAPDALRRVHQLATDECPDVIVSRIQYQSEGSASRLARIPYGPTFKSNLLTKNIGGGCVYLRRSAALNVRFFENLEFSIGEDWDFALRLAARYDFAFSPVADRIVVLHNSNSMKLASSKRLLRCADLLEESLRADKVFMSKYGSWLPRILAELTSLAALHSALEGNGKGAGSALVRGLRHAPMRVFSRRTAAILKHSIRAL